MNITIGPICLFSKLNSVCMGCVWWYYFSCHLRIYTIRPYKHTHTQDEYKYSITISSRSFVF